MIKAMRLKQYSPSLHSLIAVTADPWKYVADRGINPLRPVAFSELHNFLYLLRLAPQCLAFSQYYMYVIYRQFT